MRKLWIILLLLAPLGCSKDDAATAPGDAAPAAGATDTAEVKLNVPMT